MDVWHGVLYGVIASLLAMIIWQLSFSIFSIFLKNSPNFTINGTWVCRFSPVKPPNSNAIEIVTIRQLGEKVEFKLENYNNTLEKVGKAKGSGIFRSSNISAVYYCTDKSHPAIGAFVLRLRHEDRPILQGNYYQPLDHVSQETAEICAEPYVLYQCKINLAHKIRRFFCRSYFNSYTSALNWSNTQSI